MDKIDELGGLRGLYQDLSTITESSIPNIERLCIELEAHIDDFRKLLDKGSKNNTSRQAVLSGKIKIGEIEYSINNDFQQGVLQLADAVNLDEIESATLFMTAQEESKQIDRSPLITAIMKFHERRVYLLECLRFVFLESFDIEKEGIQELMQNAIAHILETESGSYRNASLFARKCLSSMDETEKWLGLLGEQVQKVSIVGQEEDADIMEAINYQRNSLIQQHESLGAILCFLFKGNYTTSEDLRLLINRLRNIDRFDMLLIHSFPALITALVQYGSPEGSGSQREARSLHTAVTSSKDNQVWALGPFHAAVIAIWLAVYSGWYFDAGTASPLQGVNLEKEAEERSKMFMTALDEGGLEFMLTICASVTDEQSREPARNELVALLLKETSVAALESESCSDSLKALLMEQFDTFTESCVANMPDAVRRLKSEEDNQRLNQITALRDGPTSHPHRGLVEARTYLECFLVIMAFAFDNRHEAAQEFWADHDSNLYGFLQWASKRQTVPRVSAFCEMLCSISQGEDNAIAANQFLMEEDKHLSVKFRRSTSMNWTQMFAELQLYASKVTEKPTSTSQTVLHTRKSAPIEMNEPESPVMLTCYLRLMGHLSRQSRSIREWMLQHPTFNVVGNLLTLCSGTIPTHLRASAFLTLEALMTDRSSPHGNEMWLSIDQWISGGFSQGPGLVRPPVHSNTPAWHERHAFQKIGESLDQTNAFVELIHTLTSPSSDSIDQKLYLPFPDSLGSSYRMPGIDPYIDFVMGYAFARKTTDVSEHHGHRLALNCLGFAVTSLATFNENLVAIANQSAGQSDSTLDITAFSTYLRLHPFTRVSEWLFNEDVIKTLFLMTHQDVTEVSRASSDSILVLLLVKTIDVINLVLDLQSTYLNIVRPAIRSGAVTNRHNVSNSALASFEDSILNNLNLIPDLCLYCGTGHEQLTVTSMALLEKLSSSRKLNKASPTDFLSWRSPNKIVEVLTTQMNPDNVSRPLVTQMHPDPRELEYGPTSAGYLIREGLLALLNSCLQTIADRPTVAHVLLGFSTIGDTLDVTPDGLLANGMSLLHAIVDFIQFYPTDIGGSILSWTVHQKRLAFEVLRHLWSSNLSSAYTLQELRLSKFLILSFASQLLLGPTTVFNDFSIATPEFWLSDSPTSLAELLLYRSHLYDYAITEIRSASAIGSTTLKADILSTLLGTSTIEAGDTFANPTVFDLFDFADLDLSADFQPPSVSFLTNIDFELCLRAQVDNSLVLYDLNAVQELIQLKRKDLLQNNPLRTQDEDQFQMEVDHTISFLRMMNYKNQLQYNRHQAIRSWTEMIAAMVVNCDMEASRKTTFILQAIQLILPKLELAIRESSAEAVDLSRLAETLINRLEVPVNQQHTDRSADVTYEKLHQLFQVSIRGISMSTGNIELRESSYSICAQYLARIISLDSMHETLRRNSQQMTKSIGLSLIESICDDAYAGQDNCRISALLLLNFLATVDVCENSHTLVDTISQSNYLSMFLDAIKALPSVFQDAHANTTPTLLTYYHSLLSLLQQLCQTKVGATHVLNAGLFAAVKESNLFAVDPDIGIDMDNPEALRKYYELLLSNLRVVVSAVFARGIQNEQLIDQTRAFLSENRQSMVGIFKRYAKIGVPAAAGTQDILHDLVKSFIALITAAGFVEFEDDTFRQTSKQKAFS